MVSILTSILKTKVLYWFSFYFWEWQLTEFYFCSDTAKTARGFLTCKAYRLTPQAINMYKEGEFTPEALRNLKVGFETLFIEVPVVVKNSLLTNIMLTEVDELVPVDEGTKFLDLGTA